MKGNIFTWCNISYFKMTNNILCIGFTINTIDGDITIPVIGMKHIRIKNDIKNDLQNYIPKLEKKRKFLKYLLLIKYSNLPTEMIDKIMDMFSNLIELDGKHFATVLRLPFISIISPVEAPNKSIAS